MTSLSGSYQDGRLATPYAVGVLVEEPGLRLTFPAGGMRQILWAECHEGHKLAGRQRLELRSDSPDQPGGVLELDAALFCAAVKTLPSVYKKYGRRLGLRRASTGVWLAACLLGIPLAWFLYSRGADMAHVLVPKSHEARLGLIVRDRMVAMQGEYQAPELQAAVELILDKLGAGQSQHHYRVTLVDSADVNAFAAPGGQVLVLRGLLTLTDDPLELAGVLAHEMAHVEQRHGMRQLLRSAGVMVFMSGAVGGGLEGLEAIEQATELAGLLAIFRYSRDMEREADRLAVQRLHGAGLSARGLKSFFAKLSETKGEVGNTVERRLAFISTHPQTRHRIDWLDQAIRTEPGSLETPAWLEELRPVLRRHRPTQGLLPLIELLDPE